MEGNAEAEVRVQKTIAFSFGNFLRLLWTRRKLTRRDRWTRDKLLRHQVDALNILRTHAYENSPFYRRFHSGLFDQPLEKLPVLTKKNLMENWNDVVTDQTLKIDDFRKFIESLDIPQLFQNQYIAATTSGSTGLKGVFAFNRDEWFWGVASHSRATGWAGARIGPLNRLRMAVVSSTKPWCKSLLVGVSVDTPILPTLRLDSTESLHTIVEKLNAFQPDILVSYAETANLLARQQLAGNLQISPRMIFASSEIFTEPARKRIKMAWGSEPFNAYASTETALIAADCIHHCMHLAEDLVIAEVVDRNNQPVPVGTYGDKVLVTVLFSCTVPLIRYELSDRVALLEQPDPCPCKKPFVALAGIRGRVEDTMLLRAHGGVPVAIEPDIFHDVLEPAPVDGWQVTQDSETSITISILGPQKNYNEGEIIEEIRSRLLEKGAHDPIVKIRVVEKLQQSASGKTPLVHALKIDRKPNNDAPAFANA